MARYSWMKTAPRERLSEMGKKGAASLHARATQIERSAWARLGGVAAAARKGPQERAEWAARMNAAFTYEQRRAVALRMSPEARRERAAAAAAARYGLIHKRARWWSMLPQVRFERPL